MAELQNALPPGWSCQLDRKSGRYYFINHITKVTTWDDPRGLYKSKNIAHPHPVQVEHIPLQDLSNMSRGSPRGCRIQDSSLITTNAEEAVTNISAMFPTVSDTHIRILLKKYMKSIFPKAEETMILDILSSNDNNIQKASEALKEMGYEKRDNGKLLSQQRLTKTDQLKSQEVLQPQIIQAPKIKSLNEKKTIKAGLQEKYKDIPEQVITIALESVEYDEERANQILQIMVQEECDKKNNEQQESSEDAITVLEPNVQSPSTLPLSQSRQSLKSVLKTEKSDYSLKETGTFSRVIKEETTMNDVNYKSSNLINTNGADRNLVKGANQELLLEDYIKWQGPQPGLICGPQKGLARGPNTSLLSSRTYQPCGPNPELRKGPKFGLAKGSIFSQLKGVIVGESRGK